MPDPVEMLIMWRHDGIHPLTFVHGYADLLLKGVLGSLTEEQCDALAAIDRCCRESIEKWHEFGDYFQLGHLDKQVLSPTEITQAGRLYLRDQIFEKALTSLCTVKSLSEDLLAEKLGTLTVEQREWINVINRRCEIAIDRWRPLLDYFKLEHI